MLAQLYSEVSGFTCRRTINVSNNLQRRGGGPVLLISLFLTHHIHLLIGTDGSNEYSEAQTGANGLLATNSYQITVNVPGLQQEELVQGSLDVLEDSVDSVKLRSCVFHFVKVPFLFRKTAIKRLVRHCSSAFSVPTGFVFLLPWKRCVQTTATGQEIIAYFAFLSGTRRLFRTTNFHVLNSHTSAYYPCDLKMIIYDVSFSLCLCERCHMSQLIPVLQIAGTEIRDGCNMLITNLL